MISAILLAFSLSLMYLGLSGKLDYDSGLPNDSSPSKEWY